MREDGKSVYKPSPARDAWEDSDRIESLESRANRLEARCRILTAACVTLVLAGAGLGLLDYRASIRAATGPTEVVAARVVSPRIVTSRLTVMDDAGNVYADLGPSADDALEGMLTVYNPGSKTRTILTGGAVALVDHGDKTRVQLSSEMQRGGEVRAGISLGDETGLLRMLLSASADTADVQVRDAKGAKRAAVGVATNDRPYLEMDADGQGLKRVAP